MTPDELKRAAVDLFGKKHAPAAPSEMDRLVSRWKADLRLVRQGLKVIHDNTPQQTFHDAPNYLRGLAHTLLLEKAVGYSKDELQLLLVAGFAQVLAEEASA